MCVEVFVWVCVKMCVWVCACNLQGEPLHITLQIDIFKHFRVSAFETLKRKVYH